MIHSTKILSACAAVMGLVLVSGCQQPAPPPQAMAPPAPMCNQFMVHFNTGSVLMQPTDRETVNGVTLKASDPAAQVLLIGKTDTVGSRAANLNLSRKRADAVYHALVDNGVLATRIDRSYTGKEQPVVVTADDEAEPRNRTVVILVGSDCRS